MTLGEIVARADELKPNALSADYKYMILTELENSLMQDVLLVPGHVEYLPGDDGETDPILQSPHDKVYLYYLMAQIDVANEEYSKAANTMTLYNEARSQLIRWYARVYDTAHGGRMRVRQEYTVVRGTDQIICFFALPLDAEEVTDCKVYFRQKGETVLTLGLDSGLLDYEGDRLDIHLTPAQTTLLSVGVALATVRVTDGEKQYETYPPGRLRVLESVSETAGEGGNQ